MSNSAIPTAPMYGSIIDNSSEVISFPQTHIPVTGGSVSGALILPGVPYTATLDATSAQFATLTTSDRYVTVSVPASNAPTERTITVTVTQNGNTKAVALKQASISVYGFFVHYEVTALAAAKDSTGELNVYAPVGHHIEVVTGCPWAELAAPAAAGTPSVAVTPEINIVPTTGVITYTVTATSANAPADATDKTTTAPARQANVVVRDITTGEELNVILLQAGGKNA